MHWFVAPQCGERAGSCDGRCVVVLGSWRVCRHAGVVRFLCWHVLKLEFWHFAHPELSFAFAFASVFAVFYSKKVRQPLQLHCAKNMLSSPFRIVFFRCFPVCVCVCRISHRFYSILADSTFCTCRLGLAFVFQLCAGVGGGMGGADDVHANAACVFCFFCCVTSQMLPVAQRSPCCRFLWLHF